MLSVSSIPNPTLMYYLLKEEITPKLLAIAILDFSFKGFIRIHKIGNLFRKIEIIQQNKSAEQLPYDQLEILIILFDNSYTLVLDSSAWPKIKRFMSFMKRFLEKESKEYITVNNSIPIEVLCFISLLGMIPCVLAGSVILSMFDVLAIGLMLLAACSLRGIVIKLFICSLVSLVFYPVSLMGANITFGTAAAWCQFLFLFYIVIFIFCKTSNRSLTPLGRDTFAQIAGLEEYLKSDEIYGVAASNPQEAREIFVKYITFAYTLGLHKQWIKKFTHILSKDVLEECMSCAGGKDVISEELSHSILSIIPRAER